MVKLRVPKFLKSVRYCLAAINGLFVLTGLLVLIIGITVLVKHGQYDLFITSRFSTLPGFVVATGVIILLASALGFYGAHSEQFYFVAGYTIATLVVLVFEVAIVIAGFGLKSEAVAEIRRPMVTALAQYEENRDIAITWDTLQRDFECCGVTGRHDWPINRVPISCCIMDYGQISPFECTTANAHTVGCASVLGEQLSYNAHVLASTVLFVLCLQVLISGAAAWLTYRIKFEEVELES